MQSIIVLLIWWKAVRHSENAFHHSFYQFQFYVPTCLSSRVTVYNIDSIWRAVCIMLYESYSMMYIMFFWCYPNSMYLRYILQNNAKVTHWTCHDGSFSHAQHFIIFPCESESLCSIKENFLWIKSFSVNRKLNKNESRSN